MPCLEHEAKNNKKRHRIRILIMLKFIDKNTTTENNLRIIILSLIHKRFVTMQLRNAILALTGSVLLLTGCTLKKSESKSEREESFSERDEMEKAMEQELSLIHI